MSDEEEKKYEITSDSNEFESDDDFGDFEEGEIIDNVGNKDSLELEDNTNIYKNGNMKVFNGDFESYKDNVIDLVNKMIGKSDKDKTSEDDSAAKCFQFDDRSNKIFDRLVNEETPFQSIIWKKTMIYKQLMLNLDIPTDTEPVKRNSESASSNFKVIYDVETISNNPELSRLIKNIPKFDTLDIDKKSEIYSKRINETDSQIEEIINISKNDDISLRTLITAKNELLELLSIWNEKLHDVKVDNELFTSYVENIIGNTQKFRRASKH